jgi:hypothetical protein
MRQFIIYLLLALVLFATSCEEYEYEKPLTPVCKSYIDTNLIGLWIFDGYETYNNFNLQVDSHFLLILPFNQREYVVLFKSEKKHSNDLPSLVKGHIGKIGQYSFANIRWLDGNNHNPFIYYAFKVQNDSLYYWGYVKYKIPHQFNAKTFFTKHYADTAYISAIRKYKKFKFGYIFKMEKSD